MCNKNKSVPECAVAAAAEVYFGYCTWNAHLLIVKSHVRSFRDVNIPIFDILKKSE